MHKIIYEYAMSDDFLITPQKEELLLRTSVSEVTELLGSLENALNEISVYLLQHENINQEQCKEILREIF